MHPYERDFHLILTSRPWSLFGWRRCYILSPLQRPARNERNHTGQQLAYAYLEDEAGQRYLAMDTETLSSKNRLQLFPLIAAYIEDYLSKTSR
jgi:hypothetical protein